MDSHELASQKCVPCEGGMPPMADADVEKNLKLIPMWELKDGKLVRAFTFVDFAQAMRFVNSIADVAEHAGHHPDMNVGYGHVEVTLWTHAIGGLSMNDFVIAAKIDELSA